MDSLPQDIRVLELEHLCPFNPIVCWKLSTLDYLYDHYSIIIFESPEMEIRNCTAPCGRFKTFPVVVEWAVLWSYHETETP